MSAVAELTKWFPSNSGGPGHNVEVLVAETGPLAGQRYVKCDCRAGVPFSGTIQKRGCHAMQTRRRELGIPPVL